MKLKLILLGCLLSIIMVAGVNAQDIPFIWGQHWGVGARALGMGGAYTAVSDDYSAIFYNPAGLGQVRRMEVFGSFSYMALDDKATFLGNEFTESSSYTSLNGIGLSIPVPTRRGSLVFGFGYNRVRDFDSALLVEGFIDTPGDSVTVTYNELIEGGLNVASFGGSIEMAPGLYIGGAINFYTGSRDYTWQETERDIPHDLYEEAEWIYTDHFLDKLNGVNLTLSTLFRPNRTFQFGAAIITPVTLLVKEDWDYQDDIIWDDNYSEVTAADDGFIEYKIRSPWVYRLGAALKPGPLLISGDVEFNNYSQIRFKTDPPQTGTTMSQANLDIRQAMRNTVNFRVGGELTMPNVGLKVRAGYAINPSPWKDADSSEDRNIISAGLGYELDNVRLDVGFASTSWDVPGADIIEAEKIEIKKFLFSILYRM